MVKPKSIDDVPILALTLWSASPGYNGYELRRIALELCGELKKDANVSEFSVIGRQKRQVRLTLDPQRLRAYNLSALQIMQGLARANVIIPSGSFPSGNRETIVETGSFLTTAEEVGNLVVHVANGRPVYLRNVAAVADGPAEAANYVFMGLGPAAAKKGLTGNAAAQAEAVTIAVAKQKGANASVVADEALKKTAALKGTLIPSDVQVTVTRNYGETAKDKSDELLEHMLIATISVIVLIALFLGWRESLVVAVAVPVTLALTLLINYLYGYTLNRVTLFALIFSIGILVDDAIVVVENINGISGCARSNRSQPCWPWMKWAIPRSWPPSRHCRAAADGVCLRPHGALHAADPGRRIGGDALFSAGGLHCQPLAVLHRFEKSPPQRFGGTPRGKVARTLRKDARPVDRRAQKTDDCVCRRGRAFASGRAPGASQTGHHENAPLRQQERIAGHHRHARRPDAGRHGRRDAGAI
jgi:hypothetical protein